MFAKQNLEDALVKAVRYVNLPSDFSGKLHENFFQMFTKCLFQRV